MKDMAIRKEESGSLYLSKRFFDRFGEGDLARYGFIKVQAPEDCEVVDFNQDMTFSFEKYNARKNKIELNKELNYLKDWFDEYDNQVKQYQRCLRLGIGYDKNIVELDNQAKINQERIREIRLIIGV